MNKKKARKKFKHLTLEERICIETLVRNGYTATAIAKQLNRSVSSITRELKRNRVHGLNITKEHIRYRTIQKAFCSYTNR